jgi:uncharacterized membrane protein YkvA (DUF1232 family)/predicted enzyme related to lactoylglutathione lyase
MMRGLLIGLGIAVGIWLIGIVVLIALGRRSQARELATLIPNLLALFRDLLRDPRVPRSAKIWLGVAVVWIASPIDLIPEFIPIAGPLDDAIVAALVLRHLIKLTPPAVVAEHWRGDPRTLRVIVGGKKDVSVVAHSVRVGDRDDEVGGGANLPAISPLHGVSTVNFFAADHAAAKQWYTEFLGVEPYFERPGYVEFRIGDHQDELGIIDSAYVPGTQSVDDRAGVVVYWHVDDVDAVLQRAVGMGATQLEAPEDRGHGFITATAVDPFGNILGIMYNPHYVEILSTLRTSSVKQ